VNPFLTDTLAAIRAEAEATKPVYMASSAAVAELIAERVERGILNAAEAAEIAAYLADEYRGRVAVALEANRASAARRTRDLCQDCWQDANPTEYAPVATRFGPCAECGAEALVVRSRRADEAPDTEDAPAVVNPDGSPTAATLAFFGATRRQCDLCPFGSSDPVAIRGHEAGPSSGRGWYGQGERHTMR